MRVLLIGLALALSACGDEPEAPTTTSEVGGDAEGTLLEGTISDEMIEYEKIGAPAESEDAGAGE